MAVKKSLDSTVILPKNTKHRYYSSPAGDYVQLGFTIPDRDDDSQVCLSCPYCNVDIQVHSLCLQLQEEHCRFNLKNAVCPVCDAHLGREMIDHFTVHNSHLIKWKKPEDHTLWPNNPAILGTELQDLASFMGAVFCNTKNNASSNSTPDPLLSPFICSVRMPNAKSDQEIGDSLAVAASASSDTVAIRYDKELDHDTLERIRKSMFVQQILLSTIF